MSKRSSESEHDFQKKRRRSHDTSTPPLYDIFHGEVATVKEYGVFVKIPGFQKQGLVHKSQISKARVDDPSDMFTKGEMIFCKVISISDDGEKIGLAMKNVNQATGKDLDPNNVELSQDEKRRKQGGGRGGRPKIELEAVFNTVCRKCNGHGHLAQDCFKTGDKTYDLIPNIDEYMDSVKGDAPTTSEKKERRHDKKKKKSKGKKKKHKRSTSESSDSGEDSRRKKRKHSKHSDSDSDDSRTKKKKKKKKRKHSKHRSSSSSEG